MSSTQVRGRRWTAVGDRVLRGALAALFLVAAAMKLAATDFEVAGFARFGYAPWFMYLVGAAQALGAVLLLVRGWTGPAALGLAALMVGAVGSHLRAGDPVAMALPALVLVAVLGAIAYARRRELVPPRRLAAA